MIEQHKTIKISQAKQKPLYIVKDKIVTFQSDAYRRDDGQTVYCVDVRFVNGEHIEIPCSTDTEANRMIIRLLKELEEEGDSKK